MLFVLVHSPLVGPTSFTPVAEHLRALGHDAAVPDLAPALTQPPPYAPRQVARVLDAIAQPGLPNTPPAGALTLVAHSGAGALLPAIAAALPHAPRACIFVDAALPRPCRSAFDTAPDTFVTHVRSLEHNGMLPPWSEWWGPDAMQGLLPDLTVRAAFTRDLPATPIALFEEPMPDVPNPDRCAYLRLSPAYDDLLETARESGWPTASLDTHHLAVLTEPEAIAQKLLHLAAAIESAG